MSRAGAREEPSNASTNGRDAIVRASFRPSWWLPGPHPQTLWGHFTRPRRLVAFRREWLPTTDGDAVALDHVARPDLADGQDPAIAPARQRPRLLVLHGLEGSSYSVYVQGLLGLAVARGWDAVALNFRSCARDPAALDRWLPNRRPRLYHSGETTDLDLVVRELARRASAAPLFAAGISLGGNVLLKWLGEHPEQRLVRAAATISAPYDLAAGARHLENGLGRLYLRHFLPTLLDKVEDLDRRFPDLRARGLDLSAARAARDFFPFDDAATAPIHGFASAADYYARSSSLGFASRIATPALCVSAADDPFLPRAAVEAFRAAAAPPVEVALTPHGGHVGFIAGARPGRTAYWAEERVVDWLARHA